MPRYMKVEWHRLVLKPCCVSQINDSSKQCVELVKQLADLKDQFEIVCSTIIGRQCYIAETLEGHSPWMPYMVDLARLLEGTRWTLDRPSTHIMILKVDSRDHERDKKITWFNEFCQYAQCIIKVSNKIEKLANYCLTYADQYIRQNSVYFLNENNEQINVDSLKLVQTNRTNIDYLRIECIKIDAEVRARFQGLVMATNKTLYAGL